MPSLRRFDPAVPEMMDRPGQNFALLEQDLRFLQNINRWLGGWRIVLRYLDEFTRDWPREKPLTLLDLATGSADIPRQIVGWAKRKGLRVTLTACDGNDDILRIARAECAGLSEIQIEKQNLLALPYPPASFDFVLCSLCLHHFTEADATAILRRMGEIARVGFLLNDLRRCRAATLAAKLLIPFLTRNPIARFDAPASCERAFTETELATMAHAAGLSPFQSHRHFSFRQALVGKK